MSSLQLEQKSLAAFLEALKRLDAGFSSLPEFSSLAGNEAALAQTLNALAERLRDNYPYFHPLYAGQMLKPPHPIARLAYAMAMWINPNNHALDGGRATSAMEKESVAELAGMFGWKKFLGHLCGGGTMANLEALWVAGQLAPGKKIIASDQAHYTHRRISSVLQLDFESIPVDSAGRMEMNDLTARLARGGVGTVVATMGTTATGSIDPLPEILQLRAKHGFRVHADAAYGGYFVLAENVGGHAQAGFAQLGQADSIVIDPHKHGLQPYGCGCVLFRDPSVGQLYKHDSPYTYFSSPDLHLGEISLECSRPGAAAAALWATQNFLPLVKGEDFARGLERGRSAALRLHKYLRSDNRFVTAFEPELDIVVFAPRAASISEISERSRTFFESAAKRNLHLALAQLPAKFFSSLPAEIRRDQEIITVLRSVLMKPEHLDWVDRIWEILTEVMEHDLHDHRGSARTAV